MLISGSCWRRLAGARNYYRQITAGSKYRYGDILRQSLDLSLVTDEGKDATTFHEEDESL